MTTYDAGMAVPDWPNTYGYNLFLYPWQTWVYGPWELFIEHGHRLFGSLVGMMTIGLVAVGLVVPDRARWCAGWPWRRWRRVIFQGVLGGMRVIDDEVQLAKIHGCVGPGVLRARRGAGRDHFAALATAGSCRGIRASLARDRTAGRADHAVGLLPARAGLAVAASAGRRASRAIFASRLSFIWPWPRPCWCTSCCWPSRCFARSAARRR